MSAHTAITASTAGTDLARKAAAVAMKLCEAGSLPSSVVRVGPRSSLEF